MVRRALPAIVCVVSVLAILVELLTGGGASKTLGLDPVAAAATRSLESQTAQVEMVMRQGGERAVLSGVMDLENDRGELHGVMAPMGEIREVVSGTTVYVDVPPLAQAMDGRHWMKLDLKEIVKKLGGGDLGSAMDTSNPAAPLEQLARAGLDPQLVGHSSVRGEATTKYHVEFTLSQYMATLSPDQAEVMRRLQEKAALADRIAEDVWIDAENRVRRLAIGYDQAGKHVSMRMDFVRYGVPVHVELPPEDETVDALKVLEKAGMDFEDLANEL